MPDRIELRGLRVLCHVGATADERAQAQPIEFDLDLEVDLQKAGGSDELADTIDYGAVAEAVVSAVTAGSVALVETLACAAADAALAVDERATAATVTVRKLRPPVPLDVASTGVRITRSRP